MAIDFPSSPVIGELVDGGTVGWVWDGAKWAKAIGRFRELRGYDVIPANSLPYVTQQFTTVEAAGPTGFAYGVFQYTFRYKSVGSPSTDSYVTMTLGWNGLDIADPYPSGDNTVIAAAILRAKVSTGTAPMIISSTTKVSNLNADRVDDYHADEAATGSTVVARTSAGYVNATWFNASNTDSGSTASHYIFMQGSDGYYRRKTLASVQAEIVTNASVTSAIGNTGGIASLTAVLANNASSTVSGSGDVACGLLILRDSTTGGVAMVSIDPGIAAIVVVSDPSSLISVGSPTQAKWEITTSGNNVVITNRWGVSHTHKSVFISTGGAITFT